VDRRAFLASTLGFLAAPLAAVAQPAGKVYRVGWLVGAVDSPLVYGAFVQGLRDHGYTEGSNLVIERRNAEGNLDRLPDRAAELVRLKVDVILATTSVVALAAKGATTTIPIVMGSSYAPVERGLVASLAAPGGNVTGLTNSTDPDFSGKQIQLLKEVVPGASHLAVLAHSDDIRRGVMSREIGPAVALLKLGLQVLEIRTAADVDDAFAAATRGRADMLLVWENPVIFAQRARIAELAAKLRLPSMCTFRELADAGCLMAYGPSVPASFRRAAYYVDRILRGAKPADLPIEQPTKFDLVINLKTAKALGLTIPPSVLARADEVIE
jgi:ABC-type uncharacterized transport system substrate-binding protein